MDVAKKLMIEGQASVNKNCQRKNYHVLLKIESHWNDIWCSKGCC